MVDALGPSVGQRSRYTRKCTSSLYKDNAIRRPYRDEKMAELDILISERMFNRKGATESTNLERGV